MIIIEEYKMCEYSTENRKATSNGCMKNSSAYQEYLLGGLVESHELQLADDHRVRNVQIRKGMIADPVFFLKTIGVSHLEMVEILNKILYYQTKQ